MKVLIVAKDQNSKGGVANYFRLFYEKFSDIDIIIEQFEIGSRAEHYNQRLNRNFAYLFDLIKDLWRLVRKLRQDNEIKIVHVNPSLIPVPLIRDGLVIIIAKIFRRKVLVFFHGWLGSVMTRLKKNYFAKSLFIKIYKQADHIFVLALLFRDEMCALGFEKDSITITRTMFDGELIQPKPCNISKGLRFMFLSRISIEKGVLDIIKAIAHLKENGLSIDVDFFGHAANSIVMNELEVSARNLGVLSQCHFCGYVDGIDKYAAYSNHDVFLFPTFHPEGCPTVVLEALASGCFVICTDVAALKEIVVDNVHGRIIKTHDYHDLADKIMWSMENEILVHEIGNTNQEYAFRNFEANVLVNQVKGVYRSLLSC